MSLSIDSHIGNGHNGQVQNYTVSLTTDGTDELIVLLIAAEISTVASPVTISSVSGASLTWNRRANYTFDLTAGVQLAHMLMEVWWAWASSQITSQTITVATNSNNTDCCNLTCYGIKGIPPSQAAAPWDTNASLPAKTAQPTNVDVAVQATGVTTDDGAPFVICHAMNVNSANPLSNAAASGHTKTDYQAFSNINNASFENEYFVSSGKLTSATVAANSGNHRNWGLIVDAVASGPPLPSTRRQGHIVT